MRLVLVRHGSAHAGLTGIIGGPTGCQGLTDLGRRQAQALGERFANDTTEVDVLVASEIPRAIETAELVAPGAGVDQIPRDCDLCEVHVGEADGMDWADYSAEYGSLDMMADPDQEFAPGGDSWNSFHERVDRVMGRLATAHAGKTVVAVTHAGVIAATLRLRLGMASPDAARLQPTNTGLTEWEHDPDDGTWTLRRYNDATHLLAL